MLIMKQLNEYSTLRNFSYRPILHRIGGGVISHNIILIPNNSQTTLRAVPFAMSTNEDY